MPEQIGIEVFGVSGVKAIAVSPAATPRLQTALSTMSCRKRLRWVKRYGNGGEQGAANAPTKGVNQWMP